MDVDERGANGQRSSRRLFMQLQAFGGCADPKVLVSALERSQIEAVLYADLHDARGVGVLTFAEDPGFFVTRLREVLGAEPFATLPAKPAFAMIGRSYASGYEQELDDWLLHRPRRTVLNPDWPWAVLRMACTRCDRGCSSRPTSPIRKSLSWVSSPWQARRMSWARSASP